MSLLSEINGSLLLTLAGREQRSNTSDPLASLGVDTPRPKSAREEAALISLGLPRGVSAFSDSASRTGLAYAKLTVATNDLSQVKDLVTELHELAALSASPETLQDSRGLLNTRFKKGLTELKKLIEQSGTGTENYLNQGDLKTVLEEAGISLSALTELAQSFNSLGGSDDIIGYEKITIGSAASLDPYSQKISSLESAIQAEAVFAKLATSVSAELEDMNKVRDELLAANIFAANAAEAFYFAQGQVEEGVSAQELADSIVRRIRIMSEDGSLSQHSDLDRTLAAELLGSS